MAFQGADLVSLANLLRQSDPTQRDEDDSDDDEVARPHGLGNTGPGHIGAKQAGQERGRGTAKSENIISKGAEIWEQDEVRKEDKESAIPIPNDPRKTPKYEMYYRQSVTSEDVFLQMGNKTPSSASCENLVVEIHLPDEEDFNKIQLNVKEQAIDLRSPNHFLYLGLPHPIDTKAGHAKWDQVTEKLTVTLKLSRELDGLNF